MELKNVLKTISAEQIIQVVADNKEVFFGKISDTNGGNFLSYIHDKVYKIGYNEKIGAITIAC